MVIIPRLMVKATQGIKTAANHLVVKQPTVASSAGATHRWRSSQDDSKESTPTSNNAKPATADTKAAAVESALLNLQKANTVSQPENTITMASKSELPLTTESLNEPKGLALDTTKDGFALSSSFNVQEATKTFDLLTGVNEISALKQAVHEASAKLDNATTDARALRATLENQSAHHRNLSNRHARIMERRENWTETDVREFADVTAAETRARADVDRARKDLHDAEESMHRAQVVYVDALRRRYQEEQVWQDKWRILGTYWTWSLIGLNSLVFVVGQFLHYRREDRRMNTIRDLFGDLDSSLAAKMSVAVPVPEANETGSGQVKTDVLKESSKDDATKIYARDSAEPVGVSQAVGENETRADSSETSLSSDVEIANKNFDVKEEKVKILSEVDSVRRLQLMWQRMIMMLNEQLIRFTQTARRVVVAGAENTKAVVVRTKEWVSSTEDDKYEMLWVRISHIWGQLHWPSVAFGALTSSLSVGMIILATPRERRY